jgi:hypothetical protein
MAPTHGQSFVMGSDRLSFSSFILGLASNALIHLGDTPHPETGSVAPLDLQAAAQTIDVLEVLRTKTVGNLSAEENRLLADLLTDLRLRFVNRSKP